MPLLTAYMGRGYFIHKNPHQQINAVWICFCLYTRHTSFVHEVLNKFGKYFRQYFVCYTDQTFEVQASTLIAQKVFWQYLLVKWVPCAYNQDNYKWLCDLLPSSAGNLLLHHWYHSQHAHTWGNKKGGVIIFRSKLIFTLWMNTRTCKLGFQVYMRFH